METSTKTQRAKVGVAGSYLNQMMSNNSSLPEVGKGATQLLYSDRICFEVVEVSKDGKTVKMEVLDAEFAGESGTAQIGHQNWKLTPTGRFTTVAWRHGAWRQRSEKVMFTEEYAKTLDRKFHGSEDYKKCFVDGEMVVVEGITELKVQWHKMNILFGRKDYYYDWTI